MGSSLCLVVTVGDPLAGVGGDRLAILQPGEDGGRRACGVTDEDFAGGRQCVLRAFDCRR